MIPHPVLAECRKKADRPPNRVAAVVVAVWIVLAALAVWLVARAFG